MSDIIIKDISKVRVEVLWGSPADTDDVDIRILIETPMYIVQAYDFCEKEKVADYAYANLKNILNRPAINDACLLMRYLFYRAIEYHEDGMFIYPKTQFAYDHWKKNEIKKFEHDFSRYHLQGIVEYDFENDSEVIVCYRDFIKSFIRVDIIDELPF